MNGPDPLTDAFVLCLFLFVGAVLLLAIKAGISIARMVASIVRESRRARAARWWL